MKIKEIAYFAHIHLRSFGNTSFSHSHVHEFLAASLGYKSYAAFNFQKFQAESDWGKIQFQENLLKQRCLSLGYDCFTTESVITSLKLFLKILKILDFELGYGFFYHGLEFDNKYEMELDNLINGLEFDNADDMEQENIIDDSEYDCYFHESDIGDLSLSDIEDLAVVANNRSAMAHYILALYYSSLKNKQDLKAKYWYTLKQQGKVLTNLQMEWSDAYEEQLFVSEKYEFHLRASAELGCRYALLNLADQYGDLAFFKQKNLDTRIDPVDIIEIIRKLIDELDDRLEPLSVDESHTEFFDKKHDSEKRCLLRALEKWLIIAAEQGDTEAMRELIEDELELHSFSAERHVDALFNCWVWVYLAILHGVDLFEDEYYAVDEDGSPYDDERGGVVFVGGRGGIELPPLNNVELEQLAKMRAQDIFNHL